MRLKALLMLGSQQPLLAAALDRLGIEQDPCASAHEAVDRLSREYYSALVLDFDVAGAAYVAGLARLAPPKRRPVIFGLIGATTHIAAALQSGANFVLYKPLVMDQVARSLRAGKGFMRPDRRQSDRAKLEALVYLQFDVMTLPAIMFDLNEKGISFQTPEPLPPIQQVPFRFVLPGTHNLIEGVGEIIWADAEGRGGLLFSHLSASSRRHLKSWLNKRICRPATRSAKRNTRTRLSPLAH
jgi:ActR/RegA family two-component response regulator